MHPGVSESSRSPRSVGHEHRFKHIGIAAVSPEGAALCYRSIYRHAAALMAKVCAQTGVAAAAHVEAPTVSVFNLPVDRYIGAIQRDDWRAVGEMLRRSAEALAALGAQVCICPDNAVQHGLHIAEVGSKIPWIHMADPVAEALVGDARHTVGVIGTSVVTRGAVYQTQLGMRGVKVVAPDDADAGAMDAIIYTELVRGRVRPESRARLARVIEDYVARGCDAVVLGCSEAPLAVDSEASPLPVYDSTDLLAARAVQISANGLLAPARLAAG
jgi:aspartate racemase